MSTKNRENEMKTTSWEESGMIDLYEWEDEVYKAMFKDEPKEEMSEEFEEDLM
ncbi:MAG: hypothetical protein IJZ49_01185 [Alistipes sp.]|nr:hypothetical protein [Alistipes sp.]